jgi:hypothetical protein
MAELLDIGSSVLEALAIIAVFFLVWRSVFRSGRRRGYLEGFEDGAAFARRAPDAEVPLSKRPRSREEAIGIGRKFLSDQRRGARWQ